MKLLKLIVPQPLIPLMESNEERKQSPRLGTDNHLRSYQVKSFH